MQRRHLPWLAVWLALVWFTDIAWADEAAVRAATQALVQAWNRHDSAAWASHLSDDTWYTQADDSFYRRYQGKNKAIELFASSVRNSDLQWDIVRMKTRPDGIVSVVMVERVLMLPKVDGAYKATYTSDPVLARWRREVDGAWRVMFFTSHAGWARAEIKNDDDGLVAASGPPATSSAVAAAARPPRRGGTGEPKEYSEFFGQPVQACNYCHGRPPSLPDSERASRIVAIGASTIDGPALRAAMQRKDLGGVMDKLLADPALSNDALENVRRYLVEVRDGVLPEEVLFDRPGATRKVELRNERSSRDAPARIILLNIAGPFAIDAKASTCRRGVTLKGQSSCVIVLRALPRWSTQASGTLDTQFAPSRGLDPAMKRARLGSGRS